MIGMGLGKVEATNKLQLNNRDQGVYLYLAYVSSKLVVVDKSHIIFKWGNQRFDYSCETVYSIICICIIELINQYQQLLILWLVIITLGISNYLGPNY